MRIGLLGTPNNVTISDRFSSGINKLETITCGGALQKLGNPDDYKFRAARSGVYSHDDRVLRNAYGQDIRNFNLTGYWSDAQDDKRSTGFSSLYHSQNGARARGADLSSDYRYMITCGGGWDDTDTLGVSRFKWALNHDYEERTFTDTSFYGGTAPAYGVSGNGTNNPLYWYTISNPNDRRTFYPQFSSVAYSPNGDYLLLCGIVAEKRGGNIGDPAKTYWWSFTMMSYELGTAYDPRTLVDHQSSIDGKGPYYKSIYMNDGDSYGDYTNVTPDTSPPYSAFSPRRTPRDNIEQTELDYHGRDCAWHPNGTKFYVYSKYFDVDEKWEPCSQYTDPNQTLTPQDNFYYKSSWSGSNHFFMASGYTGSGQAANASVTTLYFYPRFQSGMRFTDYYDDAECLLRITKTGGNSVGVVYRIKNYNSIGSQRCTHSANFATLREEFEVEYVQGYLPFTDGDDGYTFQVIGGGKIYENSCSQWQVDSGTTLSVNSLWVGNIYTFWWSTDGKQIFTINEYDGFRIAAGYTHSNYSVSTYRCPTAWSLNNAYLEGTIQYSSSTMPSGGYYRSFGNEKLAVFPSTLGTVREYRMNNF
jgi:hypothetical protein